MTTTDAPVVARHFAAVRRGDTFAAAPEGPRSGIGRVTPAGHRMKFLLITLITHNPDPVSGERKSPAARLREVLDKAILAEELGFDGFAVGERHEDPFISSSPPVVLSNIAARTSKIGLFTGVTTLSLLDPVRAFEDYSTLDNLSGGRLGFDHRQGQRRGAGRVVPRDHRGSMGPQS